jgi:hypothetical protein
MFDQENLLLNYKNDQDQKWDWKNSTTWRKVAVIFLNYFIIIYILLAQVHVLFGRNVKDSVTSDAVGRMFKSFLDHTSITSTKKTHLARRSIPAILEEMG